MALSSRAQVMLAEAVRHPCPRDRLDIVAAIEREHLPVFDRIVRFQETYGGIEYRVPGTEIGFHLGFMEAQGRGVSGFAA